MSYLHFSPRIPVAHLECPIDAEEFAQFEHGFAPLVESRSEVYRRIPGGGTWPEFVPPREKILEYFLTTKALALGPDSTYLDAASCMSLFPNYVAEALCAEVLRQDLFYRPEGVSRISFPKLLSRDSGTVEVDCIGSDGCDMAMVASASLDAIGLHCSFEHFEGDGDFRMVREAMRVLKPGGRLLIIPFYCGDRFTEVFKPEFAAGCQFHRYYDPPTFESRVLDGLTRGSFLLEMRYYRNVRQVDPSFYCDYSIAIRRI